MQSTDSQSPHPGYIKENKHLLAISLITFLIIYLSSFVKGYGFFIDEFYYIACASHPAFGYVDHPPLAPFLLTVIQFVFGSSLYVIRVLPALAASASVFFTGILAREIGGGRFAQALAACAMAASPTVAAFGGFYSMNAFEPLLATVLLYCSVRMIKEDNPRWWLILGLIMGLGVMNKHTFGVFIIALILSLAIASKWRLLLSKWILAGGLVGLIIILPNILWQIANDYPSLEFYRNISARKNMSTPPVSFILGQVMGMSPFTVPIWCGGAIYLIFSSRTKDFRFFAVLFLTLFLFMMISGTSRSDRLMFAYPPVFAGGGLLFEVIVAKYRAGWLKGVMIGGLCAGLALALPIVLPYFSYEQVRQHTERLGLNTEIERGNKPPLPQLLADRIGWEEKVELVVKAYQALPPGDQNEAIIAAGNYGQAGAIELFGRAHNLPPVVCAHNTYYLWSKKRLHGSILLQLSHEGDSTGLRRRFDVVEPFGEIYSNPYVTSHENNLRVFICCRPKIPFEEMLERSKTYY